MPGTRVSSEFFEKKTVRVAKNLLGTCLVHDSPEGRTVGRIVETEAYLYNDPSCHGFRGETARNRMMFGPPGYAYIYFIYGMYFCFNIVTAPKGVGEAVLIRALEPVEGIEIMKSRRTRHARSRKGNRLLELPDLCNGPAKLVIAMGITPKMNGASLLTSPLTLFSRDRSPVSIVTTTRIGISEGNHLPLRYYLKGNPFVSRK